MRSRTAAAGNAGGDCVDVGVSTTGDPGPITGAGWVCSGKAGGCGGCMPGEAEPPPAPCPFDIAPLTLKLKMLSFLAAPSEKPLTWGAPAVDDGASIRIGEVAAMIQTIDLLAQPRSQEQCSQFGFSSFLYARCQLSCNQEKKKIHRFGSKSPPQKRECSDAMGMRSPNDYSLLDQKSLIIKSVWNLPRAEVLVRTCRANPDNRSKRWQDTGTTYKKNLDAVSRVARVLANCGGLVKL